MRIFVLGAGASGALLAQLLSRQGHQVTCGDRNPERSKRFLGKKNPIPVVAANARNVRSVVRAARGCHLLVNASPAKFNESALRAALRLRAHYLDLSSHLVRNPFKAEQLAYGRRFAKKSRTAVINAGVAPGLTNLLAARAAEMLDQVEAIHVRLYQSTDADDPVSQWSAEGLFDEALSHPRIVRQGRFRLAKRFSEPENFRFPQPVGVARVVLLAQDEVGTLPQFIPVRELDVKAGGNEIDRLRRWHRQGKLTRSRGLVAARFPHTLTPRQVARLIRRGRLQNARFAAAVIVRGNRKEEPLEIRWDVSFPTLYQIRMRGLGVSPITYATAQMAALFVRYFPRTLNGVFPPEALPAEVRQAVLAGARTRAFRFTMKTTRRKQAVQEEDW